MKRSLAFAQFLLTAAGERPDTIERAGREDAHAVRLEEDRAPNLPLQRAEGRVEALDVADLQDRTPGGGRADHLVGLGQGAGDRLLDEHVDAGREAGAGDLPVAHGRGRDAHRVDPPEQHPIVGLEGDAVARGDLASGRLAGVADGDEFGLIEGGVDAGVLPPKMADPDDGGLQSLSHGFAFQVSRW